MPHRLQKRSSKKSRKAFSNLGRTTRASRRDSSHQRKPFNDIISFAGTMRIAIAEEIQRGMEEVVVRKLTLRLVPFLFLLYIVAYLDRINVGFAALQMQRQLSLNDSV